MEMKTSIPVSLKSSTVDDLEYRAIEALRVLLGQVSVIKLKEIRRQPRGPMLARIDVLGHSHTLACEIEPCEQPENLRSALRELRDDASRYDGAATPVLIAQHFSPEAQALCKEASTGYLDLDGNARLALGEVFIGKRSVPCRASAPSAVVEPEVTRRLPPARAHHRPAERRSATA